MLITVRFPAMPASASHGRGRQRISTAKSACTTPHTTKKRPCAHHMRQCGVMTPRCAIAAESDRAPAKAGSDAARRPGRALPAPLRLSVVIAVGRLVGRGGRDRVVRVVVLLGPDPELAHHVVVLVHE